MCNISFPLAPRPATQLPLCYFGHPILTGLVMRNRLYAKRKLDALACLFLHVLGAFPNYHTENGLGLVPKNSQINSTSSALYHLYYCTEVLGDMELVVWCCEICGYAIWSHGYFLLYELVSVFLTTVAPPNPKFHID